MTFSVTAIKLLTALVIFLCGLLSTLSPLFVVGKNEAIFSAGNMMASGVLLAAGLIHQLPDSSSSLDEEDGYPWSFLICGLTFLLFLLFEESIHLLLGGNHSHGGNSMIETDRLKESHSCSSHTCRGSIAIQSIDTVTEEYVDYGTNHNHSHDHQERLPTSPLNRTSFSIQPSKLFGRSILMDVDRQSAHHHHDDHISSHLHGSLLASLMLLMALSAHSVLAGLSIGLVLTTQEIMSIAIAIVAHKMFAGYALGSTMVAADLEWHIPLSIAFSCSTPLGILIGIGLNSFQEDSKMVGVVQAVVAGTFLYVAIIEVGMKELLICRHDDGPLQVSLSEKQMEALKLLSMLLGFLGMSYLAAFV